MDRKKLFQSLFYLIFFIFILNFAAGKFYWYSSIWYFDIIMHFLGGFWVGLFFLWFFDFHNPSFKLILQVIIGVLFIGLAWEIYEILVNDYIARNAFNILDTISDICFDLAGGFSAIFYVFKKMRYN